MSDTRTLLFTWLLLIPGAAAHALDRIGIAIGDVQGDGWQARALTLHIDLPAGEDLSGEITMGELVLPAPLGSIGAVRVRCDTLQHDEKGTRCHGRLEIARLLGESVGAAVQVEHEAASGRVHIQMQELRLAAGQWRIDAQLQEGRWRLTAQAARVDVAAARELLRPVLPDVDYTLTGRVNLEAQVHGDAEGIGAAQFGFDSDALDFANASGTQAGEKLQLEVTGQSQRRGADWQGDARIALTGGALF
ncbi:MAG TPA: hypothetical protein VIR60_09840, partial [Gammaproteobacteria bacterium]